MPTLRQRLHWLNLHWLNDGALPLLLAAMRACWLWPWLTLSLHLLTNKAQPLLPLWLLVALPMGSLLLARLLQPPAADKSTRDISTAVRFGSAAVGLIVLLLVLWGRYYAGDFPLWNAAWFVDLGDWLTRWEAGIPAPLITLLAATWLWLRGLRDAAKRLAHDHVWTSFVTGLAAIVIYLLLVSLAGLGLSNTAQGLILLFFALGMVALALANFNTITGLDRALGASFGGAGRVPKVDRFWLLNTGVVVAGLLSAALLVSLLIAPQSLTGVFDAVGWLLGLAWRLISLVLLGLTYVVAVVAFWLLRWLEPYLQRLIERLADSPLAETLEALQERPEMEPQTAAEIAAAPDEYRWIALTVLIVSIAVAFFLALRRLRTSAVQASDEERDSIYSSELLGDQLGNLLQSVLSRLRRTGDAPHLYLPLDGQLDTRRTIRAVYQQLLDSARQRGHPRRASHTPLEYGARLAATEAVVDNALSTITSGYLAARYANDAPSREEAERVQAAWSRLEEAWEEKKSDK